MALLSRPMPGTLPMTFKLLAAILIPSIIITALVGPSASMGFGMAMGLGMAVTPVSKPQQAGVLILIAAVLGSLASLAGSTPWAIALLILLSALLFAASNRRSAGLLSLTPIIIILFGPGAVDLSWWEAGVWVIAGGLVGGLITKMLKIQAPVRPVEAFVAWEHGIAVGVLCAAVMYWTLASNIPHGYWIAVTVLMALRPLPEERRDTLNGRLVGTFLGAIIALLAVIFLPVWGALIVAALSMFFLIWYTMGGAYIMQALTLTPMLLIFSSLGDYNLGLELTVERVGFTIVGIAAAAVVAVMLHRWEQQRQRRKGLAA